MMDAIREKVQEMIAHCCPELKEAGQAWLDAAGTEHEAEATQRLLAEIEEDVTLLTGSWPLPAPTTPKRFSARRRRRPSWPTRRSSRRPAR